MHALLINILDASEETLKPLCKGLWYHIWYLKHRTPLIFCASPFLSFSPTHISVCVCVCVSWGRLGIVTHVSLKTWSQSWALGEGRYSIAQTQKGERTEREGGCTEVKANEESFIASQCLWVCSLIQTNHHCIHKYFKHTTCFSLVL